MADHWRAPQSHPDDFDQPGGIRLVSKPWITIVAGALTGPLVAILFVLVVIWIAGLIG